VFGESRRLAAAPRAGDPRFPEASSRRPRCGHQKAPSDFRLRPVADRPIRAIPGASRHNRARDERGDGDRPRVEECEESAVLHEHDALSEEEKKNARHRRQQQRQLFGPSWEQNVRADIAAGV